jgi:hypothetical protein
VCQFYSTSKGLKKVEGYALNGVTDAWQCSRTRASPRLGSVDRRVRNCRGLATREELCDRCRESRHAEKDEEEVSDGNVPERGDAPVQRVVLQPPEHADVTAHHPQGARRESRAPQPSRQ